MMTDGDELVTLLQTNQRACSCSEKSWISVSSYVPVVWVNASRQRAVVNSSEP
jgi:hypothetical protein